MSNNKARASRLRAKIPLWILYISNWIETWVRAIQTLCEHATWSADFGWVLAFQFFYDLLPHRKIWFCCWYYGELSGWPGKKVILFMLLLMFSSNLAVFISSRVKETEARSKEVELIKTIASNSTNSTTQ